MSEQIDIKKQIEQLQAKLENQSSKIVDDAAQYDAFKAFRESADRKTLAKIIDRSKNEDACCCMFLHILYKDGLAKPFVVESDMKKSQNYLKKAYEKKYPAALFAKIEENMIELDEIKSKSTAENAEDSVFAVRKLVDILKSDIAFLEKKKSSKADAVFLKGILAHKQNQPNVAEQHLANGAALGHTKSLFNHAIVKISRIEKELNSLKSLIASFMK